MAKITIIGTKFSDNGTAISIGHNAPVELSITAASFERNREGIVYRDPPSLFEALSLPTDMPPEMLLRLLRILDKTQRADQQERTKLLSMSPAGEWLLAKGADVGSIIQAAGTIQQAGWITWAIDAVTKAIGGG